MENPTSNPVDIKEELKGLEQSLSAHEEVQVGLGSALTNVLLQPKLGIEVVE